MAGDHAVRQRSLRGEQRGVAERHRHPDLRSRRNLLKARAPYLEFFGLTEAPFPTTADPGWIFPAPAYEGARATLLQGIAERVGLLCLLGEPGTGKTLLLRELVERPATGIMPVLLPHPSLGFDDLVEFLALKLGLPVDGVPAKAQLANLRMALEGEAGAGVNVVLLVEEAQAVPAGTLRALPELLAPLPDGSGSGLQVVLAGQLPLLEQLASAGLASRVAVRARLDPLDRNDIGDYIHGHLVHAGAPEPIFTAGAAARIARVSRGVPRLVNSIADASLVVAWRAGVLTVTEQHVKSAWTSYAELEPTPAPATLLEEAPAPSRPVAPPLTPAALLEAAEPAVAPAPAPAALLEAVEAPVAPPPAPTPLLEDIEPAPAPRAAPPAPATPIPGTVSGASREGPLPPPTRTSMRSGPRIVPFGVPVAAAAAVVLVLLGARLAIRWQRGGVPERPAESPAVAIAPTAPSRQAALPSPPAPREPLPTAAEALDVVDAFRRAYEARDSNAVERLVAPAVLKSEHGLHAVAPDVEVLARLDDVAYAQPTARVEPRGNAMEVRAPFLIRYRDRAGQAGELHGTAVWQIARQSGAVRIVGLARELAPGSTMPADLGTARP